jgi:hypothetical protein
MSAKEGMYAILGLDGNAIALLTGIDLRWAQDSKNFTPMGSIVTTQVLRGQIGAFEGSFRKAYTDNKYIGTLYLGTWNFMGTLYPRGGTSPSIRGTFLLTGGSLTNMNAGSAEEVQEEGTFKLFNLTFADP